MNIKSIFIFFLFFSLHAFSQDSVQYKIFYYPSGKVSSEGFLVDGKPDKYWKNYHSNGIISSEGNRKNFLLDSTWNFYNEEGKLSTSIDYKNGLKNGFKCTFNDSVLVSKESFLNDEKNRLTSLFYNNGFIKAEYQFEKNKLHGKAYEFSENIDSLIITIKNYKQGNLLNEQEINRSNELGKQGLWLEFFDDKKIKSESNYINNELEGYVRYYDADGKLLKIEKFEKGIFKEEVKFPTRNNIKLLESTVNSKDTVKAKQEGEYKNGIKTGKWRYYYLSGALEETGEYDDKGRLTGEWIWYYKSGKIWRQEHYENGMEQGSFVEYLENGNVVSKGNYEEGLKKGEWVYEVGDYKEMGNYKEGLKQGVWKHFNTINNTLIFEGEFKEGEAVGKHKIYYDNGLIKQQGPYVGGFKNGNWLYYLESGEIEKIITFRNGEEWKIDGRLVIQNEHEK